VYQRAVLKTHGNAFDISCPRAILMLPKNVISVNVFFFALPIKVMHNFIGSSALKLRWAWMAMAEEATKTLGKCHS